MLNNVGNSNPNHQNDGKTQIEITCKGGINPVNQQNILTFTFYGIEKDDAFTIRGMIDKNQEKFENKS